MDQPILERLNASVKANDILYFLGDFCIGSKVRALAHRNQIRCKKIFAVPGNHDKQIRKLTEEFSWLSNLAELSIHGQPVVICHYAMRVWNRSHHGAWHLYGHFHGNLPDTPTLSMDVGVDTHDFRPWHFDEINLLVTEKAKGLSELRRTGPFWFAVLCKTLAIAVARFPEAAFWPALLKVHPGSSFCATACAPPTAPAAQLKRFRDRNIRKPAI
jgi:calcineurin-like phosphoesterase family protein